MENNVFGKWRIKNWSSKLIQHDPEVSLREVAVEDIYKESIIEVWNEEKFISGIYEKALLRCSLSKAEFSNFVFEFSSKKYSKDSDWFVLIISDSRKQKTIKRATWEFDDIDGIRLGLWDYPVFTKLIEQNQESMLIEEFHEIDEMQGYVHSIDFERIVIG